MAVTLSQAEAALPEAMKIFEQLAGVFYIGISPTVSGFELMVFLTTPPRPDAQVPANVNGVPVTVTMTGEDVLVKPPILDLR